MSRMNQDYVGVGAKSVEVEDASQFKIAAWFETENRRYGSLQTLQSIKNEKLQLSVEPDNVEVPLTDSINVALSENTASVVAIKHHLVVGTPTILPIKIGGAEIVGSATSKRLVS
ncbi:hypothetical protein H4Q26_005450 [Puccinia striiformis f. sp. tritici PST-130]|nr:hypothetical protein H4Q26_005450 [Puccinia striiformis f. sp. tritici PST-130]